MDPSHFFITNGESQSTSNGQGQFTSVGDSCNICFGPFVNHNKPQPQASSSSDDSMASELEPQEPASQLRTCRHSFHQTCFMSWVKHQREENALMTCPTCRTLVHSSQSTAAKLLTTIDDELETFYYAETQPTRTTRRFADYNTTIDLSSFRRFLDAYRLLVWQLDRLPIAGLPKTHFSQDAIAPFCAHVNAIYNAMHDSYESRAENRIPRGSMRASKRDHGGTLFVELMDKVPNGLRECNDKFIRACMDEFHYDDDDDDDEINWEPELFRFLGKVVALQSAMSKYPREMLEIEEEEEEEEES